MPMIAFCFPWRALPGLLAMPLTAAPADVAMSGQARIAHRPNWQSGSSAYAGAFPLVCRWLSGTAAAYVTGLPPA